MQSTSTATEPLAIPLDVTGKNGDRPRDIKRLVVKITARHDCQVEGHRLNAGENWALIYADRLEAVEGLVASKNHLKALDAATKMAATETERWILDHLGDLDGDDAVRERQALMKKCPISPYQAEYLRRAGDQFDVNLHTGIPPLEKVEIVSEADAPITAENASRRANENLANIIAEAISAAAAGRGSKS